MKQLKSITNRTVIFREGDQLSFKEFSWKIKLADQSHLNVVLGYYIWKNPIRKQWFFWASSKFGATSFDKGTKHQARRFLKIVAFENGKLCGHAKKQRHTILESFMQRALTEPEVQYADLALDMELTLNQSAAILSTE